MSRDGEAIVAEDLTKNYGEATAVDGLDLTVPSGTIYGFLGPNGAGKTTTIGMFTTMVTPSSGTASIAGQSVERREAVKPHIGYLPDEPPLYDAFTAREQLEYVAVLRNLPEPEARIESLLSRVGLASDADRLIDTYSQGMRQKVGLLQALLHEPDVLFLDEPTNGLDPRAAREVVNLIDELSTSGTTVFLSTHILPVVEELADAVGVLHDGELVAEGPPDELKRRVADGSEQSLERAFLDVTDESDVVEAAPTEPETSQAGHE